MNMDYSLLESGQDFSIEITENTWTSTHNHWHLEFGYVLEGSAIHEWNYVSNTIEEGDFYIIGCGSPHSYMATSKALKMITVKFNPVFFDPNLFGARSFFEVLSCRNFGFDVELFSVPPTPYTYKDHDGSTLKLLNEIMEEYKNKRAGYLEVIRAKFTLLIINAVRPLYVDMVHPTANKTDHFTEVIRYINSSYNRNITLNDICSIINYTPAHMSKKFKANMGITFFEYLRRIRIASAQRLLMNTGKSIDEIMNKVGYQDKKSFYGAFRKVTGTTPDAYRRRHKVI